MKNTVKTGFVHFKKGSGALSPATLTIYPTGLVIVEWSNEIIKAKIGDGPDYEVEENKWGITNFYSIEA